MYIIYLKYNIISFNGPFMHFAYFKIPHFFIICVLIGLGKKGAFVSKGVNILLRLYI